MRRDVNKNDIDKCTEIIKSFGITVLSSDVVWTSLFIVTAEWSISLSALNDINDELKDNTDFSLFSSSVDRFNNKQLTLALAMKE